MQRLRDDSVHLGRVVALHQSGGSWRRSLVALDARHRGYAATVAALRARQAHALRLHHHTEALQTDTVSALQNWPLANKSSIVMFLPFLARPLQKNKKAFAAVKGSTQQSICLPARNYAVVLQLFYWRVKQSCIDILKCTSTRSCWSKIFLSSCFEGESWGRPVG